MRVLRDDLEQWANNNAYGVEFFKPDRRVRTDMDDLRYVQSPLSEYRETRKHAATNSATPTHGGLYHLTRCVATQVASTQMRCATSTIRAKLSRGSGTRAASSVQPLGSSLPMTIQPKNKSIDHAGCTAWVFFCPHELRDRNTGQRRSRPLRAYHHSPRCSSIFTCALVCTRVQTFCTHVSSHLSGFLS